MTAQPKPTAAERAAQVINAEVNYRAFITYDDAQDIVRLLAAAGLLATAEHDAQVAAQAWDEGYTAGNAIRFAAHLKPRRESNPYRAT